MRIDPRIGYPTQGPTKGQPKSPRPARGESTSASHDDVDVSRIGEDVKPYLEQAMQAPEVRGSAVQAAREALDQGELDTPEAARRVAGILLEDGI